MSQPLRPLQFDEADDASQPSPPPFPFSDSPAAASPPPDRLEQLESMLREAQNRAEVVEKEAYEKAYLAGEKAGMSLGQKRAEQLLASLEESLHQAEAQIAALQQSFAEAAIDLAEHLARSIVSERMQSMPEQLAAIALQAAECIPADAPLKIAVHTDDMENFRRLLDDSEQAAILVTDTTVARGTCRIVSETQDMLVDPVAAVAQLTQQLRPKLLNGDATDPA